MSDRRVMSQYRSFFIMRGVFFSGATQHSRLNSLAVLSLLGILSLSVPQSRIVFGRGQTMTSSGTDVFLTIENLYKAPVEI